MLKKLSITILFLLTFLSVYAQQVPEGFTKVKEQSGIEQYKFDSNGLTVLLMEDHSAPVLTFMVTYLVGSRNEVTGSTGSTHLLEHLMFKDTKNFQKKTHNNVDAMLSTVGAISNASTWYDRTNYFESLPSDQLELAVKIEAERMRNLLLRPEDKNSEMTVVRNEFERGENSPFDALDKQIWASAFIAHPYHHSTIGWRSDIENVPIEKLRDFYNTFYWPNNAVVVVIGDFKKDNALDLIKKYYGQIPSSPNPIPQVYTTEPEQQGPKRVIVKRPGELGVVGIAHKTPEGLNKDTYPLYVLSYILTDGKTSRFYKSLIDKNLAVNQFIYYMPFKDNSLFIPYIFLSPGVKHEDVEKIVLDEYEKIKKDGISEEELKRVVSKIIAETAYGRDGSFSIASQINEAIAMGDWTYFASFTDNIKKVTVKDIQDVVKKYFVEDKSTTGYFYPQGGESGDMGMLEKGSYERMKIQNHSICYYRNPDLLPSSDNQISKNVTRKKIEGIDVLTAKTGVTDVVTFRGSFAAGDFFSPENNSMIADLTGNMLDKGTTKNKKFELAGKLENLGATISFSIGNNTLTFSGKCLNKDVNTVVGLLAEQLRYPAFDKDELEKLKKSRVGGFRQMMEEPSVIADNNLSQLLFPKGHPNYSAPLEKSIDDISKVTIEDIKNFYNKYYGPKSMVIVAGGDIEPSVFEEAVKKSFSGWKGGIDYPSVNKADLNLKGTRKYVTMPGKTSTVMDIGLPTGLKKTDPDYIPLMFGVDVFGGGTFMARLMSIVRDDEGLTYGIYSWLSNDVFNDGQWALQGTFAPELLSQGTESTMRELRRWVKDGITEDELKNTKSRLIGEYKVHLATSGGLVGQVLNFVQQGWSPEYLDKYPDMINSLTLNQVNSAIKKYIDPDKAVIVVAGSVDEKGNPIK